MTPFIGEIRMFAGNFAPAGWAFCAGQLLPISENTALFQLIGTTYGGDGQSTFALPDLRGRVPVHVGPGYTLAQSGGVETVTLTAAQIPPHSHGAIASSAQPSQPSPANGSWAQNSSLKPYNAGTAVNNVMAPSSIGPSAGSQPHDNMLPFLAVNYILSLFGVFPSPS
jgi:microcystin-dependent protein